MTRDELIRRIFVILRDELLDADERFTPESDLLAYGFDSLTLTQLLLSIEEITGMWVDESAITKESLASTVAFAALVHGYLDKP
jgi:acyl carrier protein